MQNSNNPPLLRIHPEHDANRVKNVRLAGLIVLASVRLSGDILRTSLLRGFGEVIATIEKYVIFSYRG